MTDRSTKVPKQAVRVCYVSGSWQLITLCASLREHHARCAESAGLRTVLVFSGTGSNVPLRNTLERLAHRFGLADHIVWIDDLLADLGELDDAQFPTRLDAVRERLGVGEVAEVWVAYPWAGADRVLLECYKDAQVVLFDDGIFTYTRPWSDNGSLFFRSRETLRYLARRAAGDPRARIKASFSETRLLGRRRRDIHASYLLLDRVVGVPKPHRRFARSVDPAILQEVIRMVEVDDPFRETGGGPRALVLGANLSVWDAISHEEELRLYAGVVRAVADAGYEVWWKDHPRVPQPFHPELQKLLPDVTLRLLQADHTLPLEVFLREDSIDLIVAGLTAGLFYAPLVTSSRIRVATFAGEVRPFVQWPWVEVADLIEAVVPPLESVLADEAASVRPRPTPTEPPTRSILPAPSPRIAHPS